MIVNTPSVGSVVTLQEFRDFVRQDEYIEDRTLYMLLKASIDMAEKYLCRPLLNTTFEYWLDYFPFSYANTADAIIPGAVNIAYGPPFSRQCYIDLPMPQLVSITSLTLYDQNNTGTVVDPTNYYADIANNRIVFNDAFTPSITMRNLSAIKIIFVSGYGTNPELVPYGIKVAIMQQAAAMNECRADSGELAPMAQKALRPYKVMAMTLDGV